MKRAIALVLAAVLCIGLFAGCQKPAETKPTETQDQVQNDDGVLKILLFGHSLGNDAVWMLPQVFKNEAPDTKVVIGFLYYSGCWVAQHVQFAKDEMPVYAYLEYNSETDTYWQIAQTSGQLKTYVEGNSLSGNKPENGISQTSKFAMQRQDWDVVVMQGYPWEVANISNGSNRANLLEDTQTLKDFILENDIDKTTAIKFGWNMVWSFTPDTTIMRDFDQSTLGRNFPSSEGIMKQSELHFAKMASVMKDEMMPKYNFDYLMPSAAAFYNAYSSYMEPVDLHRDYAHASDFARAMIAYLWYCVLTDTDINDCNICDIGWEYLKQGGQYEMNRLQKQDATLTESEKNVLVEAVGNALAHPYEITRSQYTEAPAQ